MTITLDSELETRLQALAEKQGVSPEALAQNMLQRALGVAPKLEPQDEWERRLFEAAVDCGVSLPNEAFLAENLYD